MGTYTAKYANFLSRNFSNTIEILYLSAKLITMKNFVLSILTLLVAVAFSSCRAKKEVEQPQTHSSIITIGTEALATIYNPTTTTIHPKIFVKKNNPQDIDLYVIINDSELLFPAATNKAKVRIFYKIMESYEELALIDSAQKVLTIDKSATPKTYAVKMHVKPVELEKFVIQTTVTDVIRGKMNISFIDVDRNDILDVSNFNVTKVENSQPYSEYYVKPSEMLRIDYYNSNYPSVYKTVLPPFEEIPLPPYASDPAEDDTTHYNIDEVLKKSFLIGNAQEDFIYYFRPDSTINRGFAMPCFSEDYPNVTSLKDIVKPLAYLTTPEEYNNIKNAEHKKLAIDDFWYSCTKDSKRAKELIRVFYTRAIFANMYFADYRQGMLTDRGMVYIVLGPPKILAINSESEIWTYKDTRSGRKIRFVFRRVKSPFSGVEYVLRRSTELKTNWDAAVSSWRKGNIYTW